MAMCELNSVWFAFSPVLIEMNSHIQKLWTWISFSFIVVVVVRRRRFFFNSILSSVILLVNEMVNSFEIEICNCNCCSIVALVFKFKLRYFQSCTKHFCWPFTMSYVWWFDHMMQTPKHFVRFSAISNKVISYWWFTKIWNINK